MNKEYILNKIKPYINGKGMINENDYNNLFSKLARKEQYEIIKLLIEENIEIDYDGLKSNNEEIKINSVVPAIDISKLNKLTNEQLCVLYQQGNSIALDILVKKNTKLVWSRVLKRSQIYRHKLETDDLLQFGFIGLMIAAKKFDISKEAQFTTYAINWIDQRIIRGIVDEGYTIRIPVHYFELVSNLWRLYSENPTKSKEEIFEILKQKGVNRERFEEILFVMENIFLPTSLNLLVGEDEQNELGDFKVDHTSPSVEELVEYEILKVEICSVLDTLSPKEKNIIELRFGLKDGVFRTLEQIGQDYGVTRERIRQIEAKAIRRLRHPSRSNKLKEFMWK